MNIYYVSHSGIKGQKWGVRRYQNRDGTYTSEGKARRRADRSDMSEERAIISQRKKEMRHIRSMSDDELAERYIRMSAEKKLRDLMEEDIAPGRTEAKRLLRSAAIKMGVAAAAGAGAYAARVAITGNFDPGEFASYVAANPNKKK